MGLLQLGGCSIRKAKKSIVVRALSSLLLSEPPRLSWGGQLV